MKKDNCRLGNVGFMIIFIGKDILDHAFTNVGSLLLTRVCYLSKKIRWYASSLRGVLSLSLILIFLNKPFFNFQSLLTIWELHLAIAYGESGLIKCLLVHARVKEKCTNIEIIFPPLQCTMSIDRLGSGSMLTLLMVVYVTFNLMHLRNVQRGFQNYGVKTISYIGPKVMLIFLEICPKRRLIWIRDWQCFWEILGFVDGVASFGVTSKNRISTALRHAYWWRSPPKTKGTMFFVSYVWSFFASISVSIWISFYLFGSLYSSPELSSLESGCCLRSFLGVLLDVSEEYTRPRVSPLSCP